jgi:N-acetylglutamate synthase-like GNAT family acetyltransferase
MEHLSLADYVFSHRKYEINGALRISPSETTCGDVRCIAVRVSMHDSKTSSKAKALLLSSRNRVREKNHEHPCVTLRSLSFIKTLVSPHDGCALHES